MANISAGVYTKIIDLSNYVQAVPGSTGFIAALCPKGRDNELLFLGSRSEQISEFGEPNLATYGKFYGQGPYCAYNFLGESGSLYFMRVLPVDAAFSNLVIDTQMASDATNSSITLAYLDSTAANSKAELQTGLEQAGDIKPLGVFYPIGRGEFYNSISIRLTSHSNPLLFGVYILDIYEKQSDGSDVIVESFDVSFNAQATDSAGDSIYIEDVLNTFSSVLRFEMTLTNGDYSTGYDLTVKIFDKNIGTVDTVTTIGAATLYDNKQNFNDWQQADATGVANYIVVAIDGRGNRLQGWLGGSNNIGDTVTIFDGRDLSIATQSWIGDTANFDITSVDITYYIKKSEADIAEAFIIDPIPLKRGTDGSLLTPSGSLDTVVAEQLLTQAYAGIIDDKILDSDNYYFNMVFDCGYTTNVKSQIVTLVNNRRDCIAIIDNGDNPTVDDSIDIRNNQHKFNTPYVGIHEPYNKVYDPFIGKDIWVSPVYHMSYLLPRNDSVGEQWYAAAGFTRGIIDTIKEMRFSPRQGQRDLMYLKQLNPIVKFAPGYTVWSQLTSQAKASAMQDINIVRLVLYCKRALENFCRFFVFEQNDEATWGQVAGQVVSFLEDIKSRRGLYGYQVDVSATEYEKKKKTFHVNVTLNPTRIVEKIELNFFIK